MKRKYNIFILILLLMSISFLSACNKSLNTTGEKVGTIPIQEAVDESIETSMREASKNKTTTATILATGDIMFHMPQVRAAYNPDSKSYDFKDNFQYVKKYIESSDLAIGNFETVTANDIEFSGFPRFNSPKETLVAIKDAGFDILTTANNHSLDQGRKGIIDTINSIEDQGMKNIGTYKESNVPIMIEEINEIKLALLSYTYGFNGLDGTLTKEEQAYMANKIDEEKIKKDIEKARDLEVDMVAVFIHWGNEYQIEPSEAQVELGRKMVEWGANIIFGSHPHVIQKTETINYGGKDNFIIYSMGNFLSNQRMESLGNKDTEDGIMVKINLEKDFSSGQTIIKEIDYIPTWVRRYQSEGRLKYEILPIEDFLNDESLQSKLGNNTITRIKESFETTMNKMGEY